MTDDKKLEPRGLGEHVRGLTAEYAHEQGWGLDEEERTKLAETPGDIDGGTDYEYGARDFGDEPVNTAKFSAIQDSTNKETTMADEHATEEKESAKIQGDPLESALPGKHDTTAEPEGGDRPSAPAPAK